MLSRRRGFRIMATLHRERGLPVLHNHPTDWPLVRELVAGLAGSAYHEELEIVAREAFTTYGGNVREVFRACYFFCTDS